MRIKKEEEDEKRKEDATMGVFPTFFRANDEASKNKQKKRFIDSFPSHRHPLEEEIHKFPAGQRINPVSLETGSLQPSPAFRRFLRQASKQSVQCKT